MSFARDNLEVMPAGQNAADVSIYIQEPDSSVATLQIVSARLFTPIFTLINFMQLQCTALGLDRP